MYVVQVGLRLVLFLAFVCDLCEQSESRLDTYKESLDVECLKHNLGHLLSVFGRV